MSLYYQCECGEKINKLTAKLGNSDSEARDFLLYYDGQPLVQCPKCGANHKIKKPSKKILNIAAFVGAIIAVALKIIFQIDSILAFAIFCAIAGIAFAFMLIADNYFERIDEDTIDANTAT